MKNIAKNVPKYVCQLTKSVLTTTDPPERICNLFDKELLESKKFTKEMLEEKTDGLTKEDVMEILEGTKR